MGFFKKVWRTVSRPVFNPVKSIAQKINEKILNPTFIKPFEEMQDFTKFVASGGPKDFVKSLSELYRLQMLGLPLDQIGEQERTKLQRFLELKASPKIEKVRSMGQLSHAIGLTMKDIGEQMNAIRLARESGALDFTEEGKIKYNTELDSFKKFMENKRLQELEAAKGAGPEGVESLINRVQSLGQSVPQTFTPTNSNFSSFLSKVQGPSKSSSGKGK